MVAMMARDVVAAAEAAVSVADDSNWNWREYQVVDADVVDLFQRLLTDLPDAQGVLRSRLLAMLATEPSPWQLRSSPRTSSG